MFRVMSSRVTIVSRHLNRDLGKVIEHSGQQRHSTSKATNRGH